MAYDEHVADRVRTAIGDSKHLSEKKMFGGLAFLYRGNMVCGVMNQDLVLRLGEDGAAEALKTRHVRPMDFTGKPMKTMVYVAPAGFATSRGLAAWIKKALAFAKSLPAK